MKKLLLILVLLTNKVMAAPPSLQDISEDDFKKITKEFSANFTHSAVTPPGSLGKLFGFEVGVVAGPTYTDGIKEIAKTIDQDSNFSYILHAGLMGRVSIPFGLSVEAVLLPKQTLSDISIETASFGVSYDLTNSLLPIPFVDLAIKAHYGSGSINYKTQDSVSNVPVDSSVEIKTSSYGINLSAGLSLLILEPYIGVGYISSNTEMAIDATSGTIFDSSFTSSKSAKKKHSGAHLFAGANINLLLLHLGAEYEKVYDVEKITAKLSVGF